MAGIYFMGAEPADFIPYGTTGVTAGASAYRRAWLSIGAGGESTLLSHQFAGKLREPVGSLFFTCRLSVGQPGSVDPARPFVLFRSNDVKVIGFGLDPVSRAFTVIGFDDGVASVALTGEQPGSYSADLKLDFAFDLTSGRVRAWTNGVPQFDEVIPASAFGGTTVNALSLANPDGRETGAAILVSEVVAASFDLRSYRLATLAVTGDTPIQEWTGSYTDIDEVNWQTDANTLSTNETGKTAVFDVAAPPAGTFSVAGVKLTGVFERGVTGPGSVQFVTDGGTGELQAGPTLVVDQGPTWLAQYYEKNPETNAAWTNNELSQIKIGIKSGV